MDKCDYNVKKRKRENEKSDRNETRQKGRKEMWEREQGKGKNEK